MALLDSASSQCLVDKKFLKNEFPLAQIEPVHSNLQLACSSSIVEIHSKVALNIIFKIGEEKIRMLLEFYIIPELANELTLGLPFFLNRHFDSMTAEVVRFNPDVSSALIRTKKSGKGNFHPLLCTPITYVGTQVNLNSFAKIDEEQYNNSNKALPMIINKPLNGEEKPYEPDQDASEVLDPDQIPKLISVDDQVVPSKSDNGILTESFKHIFQNYDIGEGEQLSLIKEYNANGKFSIPVDKIVESIPLDYFDSKKKVYYKTTPELVKLLDLDHIPDPHRKRLVDFICKHSSLFSKSPTDVGLIKGYTASIELDKGNADISMKQYNIPYKIRKSAQLILDDYEKVGIIERFKGEKPIISNLICLPKPHSPNEYRLAFDLRLVNALYPCKRQITTSVSEALRQMPLDARHYSVIDISSSYHSIHLDEASRRNFCFWSPNNFLYAMCRVPAGFVESSTFLHQALDKVLREEGTRNCRTVSYVDDIILASNESLEIYVNDLIDLLDRLFRAGLKVNPKKCQILRNTVTFLGYGLERGKFNISEEKIRAFTDLPTPKTRLALRYYLNSCAYFRTSIPDFATHTAILYDLINSTDPSRSNRKPFRFEQKHQVAFDKLRNQIQNFLPLSNPNYSHGFYLVTDANISAISFLLFQLDYTKITPEEEDALDFRQISNIEKLESLPKVFILCGSKKLQPHLKSQSVFKLELLAILYSLKTTRVITQFSDIKLFTDCKSILHVRLSKSQCPQLQRGALLLSSFRLTLFHLPREFNTFSDILGRGEDNTGDNGALRSLNPSESDAILQCLLVPDDLNISADRLHKLLMQESPKVILESAKKPKVKQVIKSAQITDKPSLKSKRKIKPFDVIINDGDSERIVKVNMVREVENDASLSSLEDLGPGPSGSQQPIRDTHLEDDIEEPSTERGQYNILQSTRCLSETFCRGLMSVEDFIACQQNDIGISNYTGRTKIVQGMICVVRKSTVVDQRKVRPICPTDILRSFATTLHYSYKYYHSSARNILRLIKKDFFILDESVVLDEISKCFACLTSEQDMNTSQSYAENKVPLAIRTCLNFDIVSGLPLTPSNNRYIYSCCDTLSGYFLAAPGTSRKPSEIMNFFKNCVFQYVIPTELHFDQEIGLGASGAFKRFCEFYNIKPRIVSTRFSESNGNIERLFFFLKKSCRLLSTQKMGSWDEFLPFLTQSINARTTIYGYSPEMLTYYNVSRNISPIKLHVDFSNFREYVENVRENIDRMRRQFTKAKIEKIKSNLFYINKRRKPRKFDEGTVCLYKNVHLERGMGSNRILYKPCIVIENLRSGTHCFIQSLVSNRILKYSYQYLKPIRNLNSLSRLSLPLDWQEKIREAMKSDVGSIKISDNEYETSSEDVGNEPIGYGSSQESLFSIQREVESQEESD